ncbi:MAG: DNA-binding protein [Lachnospiraceae bacterium]|nr:DNA-binding protein [Lachnospiraceae bacterium]
MEKTAYNAYLFDFYGELLGEKQKRLYEESRFQDLSLSEIAELEGISRQGVHDLLKRTEMKLCEYEEKLRLVERFLRAKEKLDQLAGENPELADKLREITGEYFGEKD